MLGIIPFYFIGIQGINAETSTYGDFHSAFFESMSGFTGTGLTMVKSPAEIPYVLQWWRSLTEWTGGLGMVYLAISFLHTSHRSERLYRSEAVSWIIDKGDVQKTVKKTWLIYLLYTGISIIVFAIAGMSTWEAINHGLVGISTGGFSVRNDSFVSYPDTIKAVAIPVMIAGALSFKIHYILIVRRDWKLLLRQTEFRWFLALFVCLSIALLLLNHAASPVDNLFQAASSLGTCGFNSAEIAKWPVPVLTLLLIPMLLGGNGSSTTGGIKTSRLIWLVRAIRHMVLRKSGEHHYKLNGEVVEEGEAKELQRSASNLFFLYIIAWAAGTIVVLFLSNGDYTLYEVAFEVNSALNNVGLSAGMSTAANAPVVKWVFVVIMWIGRLEIQAVLILFAVVMRRRRIGELDVE